MPYNIQHFVPMFLKNETILADEIWTRLNRTDFVRRKRETTSMELVKREEPDPGTFNSRWTLYDIIIGAIER